MILKRKDLSNVMLNMVIESIFVQMSEKPQFIKPLYNIKKMVDQINIAKNKMRDDFQNIIIKKYGEFDGDKMIPEDNNFGFKLKEGIDQEALKKEVDAFGEGDVQVNRNPLTLDDLASVTIVPAHLAVLEPFIADPEWQTEIPIGTGNVRSIS